MDNDRSFDSQITTGSPNMPEPRGVKSDRKKRKLKILKDENKNLKDLLKQISERVSNSGLLDNEEQEALAEAIALEDHEMLNEEMNMELNECPRSYDFATSPGSKFEPPKPESPKDPTILNSGFQFSQSKSSAVVMPSVKQTPGTNFFLNNLDEVVKDLDSSDELDVTTYDLKSLREQICFRSVDFAPISPLPPTPPPKTSDGLPDNIQKSAEKSNPVVARQPEEQSTQKKHSFNHQGSIGFDVPNDQNAIQLNSSSCSASVPASSISNAGFGKYEFVSKRRPDGGVMLTFSLKDDISLNLDSNTWQITCHIPDPKRKQSDCTPPGQFEAPGNQSFNNLRRDRGNSLHAPFKRQKLSFSEEAPKIVPPTMHGVDVGNLSEKSECKSRFLASSQLNSSLNSTLLLNERSYLNPSMQYNDSGSFQNNSIDPSLPKSLLPAHSEKRLKSSEKDRLDITSDVKTPESKQMVVACSDKLDFQSKNKYSETFDRVSQVAVSVFTESNALGKRESAPENPLRKQKKKLVSNVVRNIFPIETSSKSNLVDVKDGYVGSSISHSRKQVSKKQKLTSSNNLIEESKKSICSDNSQKSCKVEMDAKVDNVPSKNRVKRKSSLIKLENELSNELISQDKQTDTTDTEGTKQLLPDNTHKSKVLKRSKFESSTELSVQNGQITDSTKSEGINHTSPENNLESKNFLRNLGLVSSSELSSFEEKNNSTNLSFDEKGKVDTYNTKESSFDQKQSTPKKESFLRVLRLPSTEKSKEEGQNSPKHLNHSSKTEDTKLRSKEKLQPCPSNSEVAKDNMQSSPKSPKPSLSDDKNMKESIQNQIGHSSSHSESSDMEKQVNSNVLELSSKNKVTKKCMLGEIKQTTLDNEEMQKKCPEDSNCFSFQDKDIFEKEFVKTRLRSSNCESFQGKKQSSPENKKPVLRSVKKGRKENSRKIIGRFSSKVDTQKRQNKNSSIVSESLTSENKDKKANVLNKKKQRTYKSLKTSQNSRNNTFNLRKTKAKILNTVSDSDQSEGNPTDEKISLVEQKINGDSKDGIIPTKSVLETDGLDPGINNLNDETKKVDVISQPDVKIKGETSSSQNNNTGVSLLSQNCYSDPKNDSLASLENDSTRVSEPFACSSSSSESKQLIESLKTCSSSEIKTILDIKVEAGETPTKILEVMNLNEIELDSFNPDAFTSSHDLDKLKSNESGMPGLSSKNLLTDDRFSFLSSNDYKREGKDKIQTKSSNSGFSFLDSNSFTKETFDNIIKKEPPDEMNGDMSNETESFPSAFGQASEMLSERNGIDTKDKPDSSLHVKEDCKDNNLEQKKFLMSPGQAAFKSSTEKKTFSTDGPKSMDSCQEQSSSLNSEENGKGRVDESDGEGTLVIADDAELEPPDSESVKKVSIEKASILMSDVTPKVSLAVSPQETNQRQPPTSRKKRRKSSVDTSVIVETGIDAAFKQLEKMKYSDAHQSYNTHFLYSAFINPAYQLNYIIFFIVKHLSTSKRNPLLSYSLNRDAPLLPLPENCIVTALYKAATKPRLAKLLPSTKRSLYNIILVKELQIYGLCSLCRVYAEICKRQNEKSEVRSLCCDLVLRQHKFAAYMIASITGVWKDLFSPSERSLREEQVFLGAFGMVVRQKPSSLTQTQWSHCSNILSETLCVELPSDIKTTIGYLEEAIKKKCLKGKFTSTVGLAKSLAMIAYLQELDLTKELILDKFVIPCLKEADENVDERVFSVFCSLYGDISAMCPDLEEPESLLIQLFQTKADTHIQVSAAVTLLQMYLIKKGSFPDFLATWLQENHSHPKVIVLNDLFHQSVITDNELLQTDICEC